MPRREQYVPTHRGPAAEPALKRGLRHSMILSGVAVAATGLAVSSGVLMRPDTGDSASAALAASDLGATTGSTTGSDALTRPLTAASEARGATVQADLAGRARAASRSDRRTSVDEVKKDALSQESGGQVTETEDLTSQDPRTIAKAMLGDFGFGSDQFSCLDSLYTGESGWNVHADNPSSSAYGIPQALPGSKMASAGPDWADSAATQIKWGLGYIAARYGTPCGAWGFKQGHGWY